MKEHSLWTPPLPFAIVAYDRNGVIGFGDHMAYVPGEELLTDNKRMWAILTNPERNVSLLGGSATMLPLLGILPPAIKDVVVVTHHPEKMPVLTGVLADRIRTADDPVEALDMALAAEKVPAVFGGASIYNNECLRDKLSYVLATEIDTEFVNTTNEPTKKFNPLPTNEWSIISSEPMQRGPKDAFSANFVVYRRLER